MNDQIKGKAIIDFEKIIAMVNDSAFEAGEKEGKAAGIEQYKQDVASTTEKLNTEYVVEKFSDCNTLDEFKDVFHEIRNRSYNFMA